jgi:hypothetical protein
MQARANNVRSGAGLSIQRVAIGLAATRRSITGRPREGGILYSLDLDRPLRMQSPAGKILSSL